MEIESSLVQRKFVQIRLPLGIVAVIILIADYWGWGWALLTDAATALVDPAWRENMRRRWGAVAGLDLSRPRAGAALPDSLSS